MSSADFLCCHRSCSEFLGLHKDEKTYEEYILCGDEGLALGTEDAWAYILTQTIVASNPENT